MSLPLPSEQSIPAKKRTVWFSAGGLACFIFALNLFAAWFLANKTPNEGYAVVRHKWKLLQDVNHPIDVLVLGDSSVSQGIDAKLLGEKLNMSVLNVATVGDMTVVDDALMLQWYLKHKPAPKLIVIGHVYDVWHRKMYGEMLAQTPLTFSELRSAMSWTTFEPNSEPDFYLARYVPLYSQNVSFVVGLKRAIIPGRHGDSRVSLIDEEGFLHEAKADPQTVESDAEGHLQMIKGLPASLSEQNLAALRQILSLANDNRIQVAYCNSPIYGGLYAQPSFSQYYREVEQLIAKELERSPNAHYLFYDPMTFSKEEMQNVDHVIEPAAERYTSQLAEQIQREIPFLGVRR